MGRRPGLGSRIGTPLAPHLWGWAVPQARQLPGGMRAPHLWGWSGARPLQCEQGRSLALHLWGWAALCYSASRPSLQPHTCGDGPATNAISKRVTGVRPTAVGMVRRCRWICACLWSSAPRVWGWSEVAADLEAVGQALPRTRGDAPSRRDIDALLKICPTRVGMSRGIRTPGSPTLCPQPHACGDGPYGAPRGYHDDAGPTRVGMGR